MEPKKSVLVGLSGGIDSAVAAFLLKEKGFRVEGIFFKFFNEDHSSIIQGTDTSNVGAFEESRVGMLAKILDIPLNRVNYQKKFSAIVIHDFISQYQKGFTPNPCILCNEKVKFHLLFNYANKHNLEFIATGHYARIGKSRNQKKFLLKRGIDQKKDQSYFLYRLNQDILSKSIFPLGKLLKRDVEKIALKIGLDLQGINESQEVCFLRGENYRKFIENKLGREDKSKMGYFLDTSGNILGKHRGIAFYTVGQRKKIGLSLNTRKYIVRINHNDHTIIVGDEADLYQREFKIENIHMISMQPLKKPVRLKVRIRYNTPAAYAKVFPCKENKMRILFDEPQRAIAPGQSAVFYQREYVIGGGMISGL